MTSGGPDDLTRETLDSVVDRAVHDGQLPSLVAAGGFGVHPWWSREVGAVGRQYRIGSITKTFTAALVMRLRDEGHLDLDDRVGTRVPDAPFADRSIRALLAHASGMPAEPVGPWWERTAGVSWEALAAANRGRAAAFAPGVRYHYSNLAFAVLGELVARVRGAPWWDCLRHELLVPLGLADTTWHPRPDAAVGTSRHPHTGEVHAEPAADTGAMAPAGQLWSTPADLVRWARVLGQGRADVLAPDTAREMRTVQAGDPDTQHRGGYGLGLRLHWSVAGTVAGHTGTMPGFQAAMFVDPGTLVSAVVMANATTGLDTERLATDLIARLAPFGIHPSPREDEPDPEDALPDLVGVWHWGHTPFTLTATIDGLALAGESGTWRFLRDRADGYLGLTGYTAGERLTVVRRRDGTASHLEVATFILTRTPYDPAAPIPGGPPSPLH